MVARIRSNPVNLGAETAQEVSGFSRISPEIFKCNKHSGLYFASIGRKKYDQSINGQYAKGSKKKIAKQNQ